MNKNKTKTITTTPLALLDEENYLDLCCNLEIRIIMRSKLTVKRAFNFEKLNLEIGCIFFGTL